MQLANFSGLEKVVITNALLLLARGITFRTEKHATKFWEASPRIARRVTIVKKHRTAQSKKLRKLRAIVRKKSNEGFTQKPAIIIKSEFRL